MIILRQKEFGWIRKKLGKSLEEDIYDEGRLITNARCNTRLINPKVEKEIKEGVKSESYVVSKSEFRGGLGCPVSPTVDFPNKDRGRGIKIALKNNGVEDATEDDKIFLALLADRDDKDISTIYWDRCDGLESLAHEIGHVKNYKGNLVEKFIRKGAEFGKWSRTLPDSVINSIISVIYSPLLVLEESNASKKGYKLLQSYKLSDDELKIAKRNLDNAIEIYKTQSRISWKRKLIGSKIPQWLL